MGRRFHAAVAFLAALSVCVTEARAQGTSAMVKGRVMDEGGTGLPGVVINIESPGVGGGNKTSVSDVEGNYRIPLLPPGNDYIIRIDYPGFAPVEVGPIDLDSGKTTVVDVTLSSDSETTEIIKVESHGNVVDTESARTTTSFNSEFIEGLPIIGHNYQDILTLAPGVTDTDGDGNPNVHGARETGLQYRLDGGNITDPFSGTFGQNLNADIIEEIELITAGASAEYGRADGGFANIITKSGGNDFEGRFSIFWQGRFLDGDGADNNDVNTFDGTFPPFRDVRASLSLGGAIVKDKLWYFVSVETLDTELPVDQVGANILVTSRGNYSFGKITWQADSFNKLALQLTGDPRDFLGVGLRLGVSPDSDYEFSQGGLTPQLRWTSTISPRLLLEANVTHLDSGIALTPVSRFFEPTETTLIMDQSRTLGTVQAVYPCSTINCDPAFGEKRTYQVDIFTGRINGPYFFKNDDTRIRNAIRADVSYNIEDAWGQHNVKSGLEFADEKYRDEPIINPVLIDQTRPLLGGDLSQGPVSSIGRVQGFQFLQISRPLQTPQNASSFNSAFFLQDAWKPRPNLTVNVGVRLDQEDIDTSGFDYFDPRVERKKSISLWKAYCAEAHRQGVSLSQPASNCLPVPGQTIWDPAQYNGLPPKATNIASYLDEDNDGVNDVPARIAALNLEDNPNLPPNVIRPDTEDRNAFFQHFTSFNGRETTNFSIENTNVSPRFSLSWDPWADGKTRLFGNWGRYYDRLFLSVVSGEIGPDSLNFTFRPDTVTAQIRPGSVSIAASTISVNQVDRELETPYTDELTLGIERELAAEWSIGLTYIRREASQLIQDIDINHVTCPQARQIGTNPYVLCGDGNRLETDKFGTTSFPEPTGNVTGGFDFKPAEAKGNDAPDLYTVSQGFNQVLRIGNYNSSEYEAYEVVVRRRLHRNWQMLASYTWSEAFGQAETFSSLLGNDPETTDDEEGFLDYDQRHVIKFQAVTRLPHEISLGTAIQWASGTPYSVVRTIVDQDSTGNQIFRTLFPSQQRNDQRNEGIWTIDGRLEKNFVIGKVGAAGYLICENILNSDDLVINQLNLEAFDGVGIDPERRFGRRFEIGATFNF